jgi:putative FmdB family regulatory protein
MPIYEYHCKSCDSEFETFVRKRNAKPEACPECDAEEIERLISNTSFKLKGSGWYETDYADENGKSTEASKEPSNGESASDGSAADAPSDTAADGGAPQEVSSASDSSGDASESTTQETDAA